VRFVYPKSTAEAAGIKVGDRIMKVGFGSVPPQPFSGPDQLAGLLDVAAIGGDAKLEVTRKEPEKKTETLTVKLSSPPASVPDKLPETADARHARMMRMQRATMVPMAAMAGGLPKREPRMMV